MKPWPAVRPQAAWGAPTLHSETRQKKKKKKKIRKDVSLHGQNRGTDGEAAECQRGGPALEYKEFYTTCPPCPRAPPCERGATIGHDVEEETTCWDDGRTLPTDRPVWRAWPMWNPCVGAMDATPLLPRPLIRRQPAHGTGPRKPRAREFPPTSSSVARARKGHVPPPRWLMMARAAQESGRLGLLFLFLRFTHHTTLKLNAGEPLAYANAPSRLVTPALGSATHTVDRKSKTGTEKDKKKENPSKVGKRKDCFFMQTH
ncbi:hypothetical protein B0I35DRAFT_138649 [Stachybotrys elegans]|uniref:Uncharacterized protein n=1 Tax=Stachybotrys elegans TaxID=80388 RepID=A0A8K0SZG8_9HYPO|nr:hypothetical protein B0I35DRAFT_138649 [Stachybotrys elegans]